MYFGDGVHSGWMTLLNNAGGNDQPAEGGSGGSSQEVWLDGFEINIDSDDVYKPSFSDSATLNSLAYTNLVTAESGNRYLWFNNMMDWKMQAATSYSGNRVNFDGGVNVGDNDDDGYGYKFLVSGTIGATGNITAYADYVCNDCGWHSGAETKKCPNCGSKEVHYHDDVALLKQIVDAQAMYPKDLEKQYQAYKKLEKLGVLQVNQHDTNDRLDSSTMIGEQDFTITQNITSLNNYLISSIVQERKQSDKLAERIDKLEGIIEMFGYEPGKTTGLRNGHSYESRDDGLLLYPKVKKGWNFKPGKVIQTIKKKVWSRKK